MLEPENQVIGTVNEDFAVESLAGDVFQLGNTSYRILRVERGTVRVEDAQGSRRTSRSGSARRPAAATSCRRRCRGCASEIAAQSGACRLRRGGDAALLALADRRDRHRRAGGASSWSNIWPRRMPRSGYLPTQRHDGLRALFRRGRRHAAGHPFALWQPHQPRLGPGAAQALLPQVQFRAAGGGDRGQHRAVADHRAQLRSRRGAALSALGQRPASC